MLNLTLGMKKCAKKKKKFETVCQKIIRESQLNTASPVFSECFRYDEVSVEIIVSQIHASSAKQLSSARCLML